MRSSSFLFTVVAAAMVVLTSTTPLKHEKISSMQESPAEVYRLPGTISPSNYSISLVITETDFSGQVTILFEVEAATNVLILHNEGLEIDSATVTVTVLDTNEPVTIATQNYDETRQFYILTFTANLQLDEYSISLDFTGGYSKDMYGVYRSTYQVDDEERWLVATQFQPTFARRAFPCFDEPGLKAYFTIRIAHLASQHAVSNVLVESVSTPDTTIGGLVWTQFQQTQLMSTYLIAFVVLEFEKLSSADEFFGVLSRGAALDTAEYALESTQALYPIIQNVVATPDPWPKLDQVAIPDFSAGAMENWGLFLYRERALLLGNESSLTDREIISSTISHELAHIWFGNLVSPKWWDHLWFNEGFATLLQYIVPGLTYPQWRYHERIVTELQLPALVADSLETTRPMNNVVGNAASALASFDTIAYSKSGAIFRMLYRIMREDLFTVAIGNFFAEKSYGTFEPEDLWRHMQTVADVNTAVQNHTPISGIMDSWINQPGYPLVTVSRNYSTTIAIFSQERFFMNPRSPTADAKSQKWWIPITISLGTNPTRCNSAWLQPDWLRAQDDAIIINGIASNTWVLANCQGIGFYRTNYDAENWRRLTAFLKSWPHTQINPTNRAILIDDSLNLARAGYIDYSIALDLIGYLVQETDYVAWQGAVTPLAYLNTILATDENFPHWQAYLRSLVVNIYETLGWVAGENDNHITRLHRRQILTLACQVEVPNSHQMAEAHFNLWIANPEENPVDPDLKPVVYCWGVRNASEATWDVLWSRFLATDLATEENVILRSLACSKNSTILQKFLQLSVTPNSGIRSQDSVTVFLSILNQGPQNIDVLLDFVANNPEAIVEHYGGLNSINSLLFGIGSRITNQEQLEKFESVARSEELGAADNVIQSSLESSRANLEWISTNAPVIENWLDNEGFIPEQTTTTAPDTTITTETITTTTDSDTTTVTDDTTTSDPGNSAALFSASSFLILSSYVLAVCIRASM